MDLSLNEEQRAWQPRARRFAQEEIRPISLRRDQIPDPRETLDWEIIRKGSKLGFRTAVVGKEMGRNGSDARQSAAAGFHIRFMREEESDGHIS